MTLLNVNALSATGSGGGWTISNFITSAQKSVMSYVQVIILIIGVVMVGFGIFQVAKNLISHGKGQTNWVVTIALIVIGGTLMLTSGWSVIKNVGNGVSGSLQNMGTGNADEAKKSQVNDGNDLGTIVFDR